MPQSQIGGTQNRSDGALIADCLAGDQDAWRELVQRYQRLVYSIANAYDLPPDDASDVFQQVWTDLYQHLAELRDFQALPAWLITVTRRKALLLIRSRLGTQPLEEDLPDVSENLTAVENEHAVERAMELLPERCRRLIELLYFRKDEPSYAEIASQLEMPIPSVGPTRARCLDKLRKLLS
jgi:RNA polymerase sigma factor (sigma-70 family)